MNYEISPLAQEILAQEVEPATKPDDPAAAAAMIDGVPASQWHIRISLYASDRDTTPQTLTVSFADHIDGLSKCFEVVCPSTTLYAGGEKDSKRTVEIPVTLCPSLTRHPATGERLPNKCSARKVAAWSPAVIDGTRSDAHVIGMSCIVLDIDHVTKVEADRIFGEVDRLNWAAICHSTHSHDPERDDHCYRLVLPVTRELTPAEITPTRDAVQAALRMRADEATSDLSRIYYLPTKPLAGGPAFVFAATGGRSIAPVSAQSVDTSTNAASRSSFATAIAASGPVDLADLRAKVRRGSRGPGREWPQREAVFDRLLAGEQLAESGERDTTVHRVAGHLAYAHPEAPHSALIELARPSVALMAPDDQGDWLEVLRDKLERARWRYLENLAAKEDQIATANAAGLVPATISAAQGVRSTAGRKCTDLGNAERLADLYGDIIRYVPERAQWIVWNGQRWEVDGQGRIFELAASTVRRIDEELRAVDPDDVDQRKHLRAWANTCEAIAKQQAMVASAARSLATLKVSNLDLDKDHFLFNVENGTIDLNTGELRAHRREDFITKLAPVRYDPWATTPLFDRVLEDALPDAETRAHVLRYLGYCLTGDVRAEKMHFWHGAGGNGKGVITETLRALFGEYCMTGSINLLTLKKGDKEMIGEPADLEGARLVVVNEVAQGRNWDESLLKQLTGGDAFRARQLYHPDRIIIPTHKFLVAGNHAPRVAGTDEGIWRRIVKVDFDVVVSDSKKDETLKARIKAQELSGVLNRLLEGLRDYHSNGLAMPSAVRVSTLAYRVTEDRVSQFIAERLTEGEPATTWVTLVDLRAAYKHWCDGQSPRVECYFDDLKAELMKKPGVVQCRKGHRSDRALCGVRLNTPMAMLGGRA